ncbi:MAG: HAD-IA family hydrolase [Clostridia bacterium]|nr:HAD-IA family hydrolase [Clostridia bacterium]
MSKYEMILFDLDDTLIDNLENVRHAYTKMVELVGEKYSEEGFKKWCDLDDKFWIDFYEKRIIVPKEYQSPQELFINYVVSLRYKMYFNDKITLEKAFEINDLFLASLKEIVVPIDGAYEVLNYLHDKYKLVIATNGANSAVKSKLKKIDCLDFVDNIFSADMTRQTVTKPSKEYFEELKEYLNFHNNEKLLIIGDSLKSDVQGGMNARIDSCWFNRNDEALPKQYEPIMVVNSLKELINKL